MAFICAGQWETILPRYCNFLKMQVTLNHCGTNKSKYKLTVAILVAWPVLLSPTEAELLHLPLVSLLRVWKVLLVWLLSCPAMRGSLLLTCKLSPAEYLKKAEVSYIDNLWSRQGAVVCNFWCYFVLDILRTAMEWVGTALTLKECFSLSCVCRLRMYIASCSSKSWKRASLNGQSRRR